MDLFTVISKRHSYRRDFSSQTVPRADLQKIVQAGLLAPVAYNRQIAEFLIVDDPALLQGLARIIDKAHFQTAPAVIACLVNRRRVPDGFLFVTQNFSVPLAQMLLTVTALGYASVWTDDPLLDPSTAARVHDLFQLPDYLKIEVLLPIGIPAEEVQQRPKLGFEEMAHFNIYQER